MNYKNLLLSMVFLTPIIPADSQKIVNATHAAAIGVAAGATVALAGKHYYHQFSSWLFNTLQNNAAYTYAIRQNLQDKKMYEVTVDLTNKNNPITIAEHTSHQQSPLEAAIKNHIVPQSIPLTQVQSPANNATAPQPAALVANAAIQRIKKVIFALAHAAKTASQQSISATTHGAYVGTLTLARNPMTLCGIAGAVTAVWLAKNPSVPMSIKALGIASTGAFTLHYLVEKYKQESARKRRNDMIIQAIQTILTDARTRKTEPTITNRFILRIQDENYTITRQRQGIIDNNTRIIIQQPAPNHPPRGLSNQ